MATTLATEKQADAIKQRMAEIRTELPYGVDDARDQLRELTDWKYHMSRHPMPILAAAAVAGYWLIPAKKTPDQIVIRESSDRQAPQQQSFGSIEKPAKRGMLGGIAGAVATMIVRQATSAAATHVSSLLTKRETS